MLSRTDLGTRMLDWHSGQSDPVYAVGSLYIDDTVYPDYSIVRDAIYNLNGDLNKFRRMNKGEAVSAPTAYGKTDDLRKFAGYKFKEIRKNITDLREIVSSLETFLQEDYNQ